MRIENEINKVIEFNSDKIYHLEELKKEILSEYDDQVKKVMPKFIDAMVRTINMNTALLLKIKSLM